MGIIAKLQVFVQKKTIKGLQKLAPMQWILDIFIFGKTWNMTYS